MAAEQLQRIRHTAQQTLVETRMLIFDLRPQILDQEGLPAALQARLQAVEGRSGIQVTSHLDDIGRLPAQVENHLYRIALEALNNSLKHAHASQMSVSLANEDGLLILQVEDNGFGFDPNQEDLKGRLGLAGMHERAEQIGGRLYIHSQPGQGVRVRVEAHV